MRRRLLPPFAGGKFREQAHRIREKAVPAVTEENWTEEIYAAITAEHDEEGAREQLAAGWEKWLADQHLAAAAERRLRPLRLEEAGLVRNSWTIGLSGPGRGESGRACGCGGGRGGGCCCCCGAGLRLGGAGRAAGAGGRRAGQYINWISRICKTYAVKICRNMPFYMQNMQNSIYCIFTFICTPHFADVRSQALAGPGSRQSSHHYHQTVADGQFVFAGNKVRAAQRALHVRVGK